MLNVSELTTRNLGPLSFTAEKGTCVAITGPSGSGKTLILRSIADLDQSSGNISLDNKNRFDCTGPQWRSMVRYLAPEAGFWNERIRDHFPDNFDLSGPLEQLGLPPEASHWEISRLSSGERQRVALIRGLMDNPCLILADEPTSALDHDSTILVEKLLADQIARGSIVILVSHDRDLSDRLATRQLQISQNQLIEVHT